MKQQNYSHHARYYAPHHFIFYPIAFLLFLGCVLGGARGESPWLWFCLAFSVCLTGGLSLMMRQHYSLMAQNRTVRLELRLRYYILTKKRFEELELRLSQKQIFALRFAPDEELLPLIDRTLKENLSPDQIKRAIKNWLPDQMRV